jgi:ureidoacrylate peracid hydrolase
MPKLETAIYFFSGGHGLPFGTWTCSQSPRVVMGLIAHTCVEATVRFAAELGYEVTMVKEVCASYSDKEMHAVLEVEIPNYATAIVTTDEVDALSSLSSAGSAR